jgi:hypothetical protein
MAEKLDVDFEEDSRKNSQPLDYLSKNRGIKKMKKKFKLSVLLFSSLFVLYSCGGGGAGTSSVIESPNLAENHSPSETLEVFTPISDEEWDETAVRKVLNTFAYGGFASDEQIKIWADMHPQDAIKEIITLDVVNEKLSPQDNDFPVPEKKTLKGLWEDWSSDNNDYILPKTKKSLKIFFSNLPEKVWYRAVSKRGLNPVRQKIGLWETNYHLSISIGGGVNSLQIFRYYDDIMNALSNNQPYEDVLTIAATSAAIATQYTHRKNKYKNGKFFGNEDFGREYHQLFFGILGNYNPEYHEGVTIKNTAKALTDIRVQFVKYPNVDSKILSDTPIFGTRYHYKGALEILGETITGNNAYERISKLSKVAINHPESLDNLPVMIIKGLADDNLTEEKIKVIRDSWKRMNPKNLVQFLREYAISKTFHSPDRIKYLSSIDRNVLITNLLTLNNEESYLEIYKPWNYIQEEGVILFKPTHKVFGSQTGEEASKSADVFKQAYNNSIKRLWQFKKAYECVRDENYRCIKDENGNKIITWEKEWEKVLPKDENGNYSVKVIAEWLWNRFIGDGLKHFGTLERAQVYSLLAKGKDFSYVVDKNNPLRVYSSEEIENDQNLQKIFSELESTNLEDLTSENTNKRLRAKERIGLAVAFIVATPYMFVQEGK